MTLRETRTKCPCVLARLARIKKVNSLYYYYFVYAHVSAMAGKGILTPKPARKRSRQGHKDTKDTRQDMSASTP